MAGSITQHDNGRWRARYRDNQGREHVRHFAKKVAARTWLNNQTAALVAGSHVEPRKARTSVGVVAADWLRSNPDWTPSTQARNRGVVDKYVMPRWGSVRLDRLAHGDLQEWIGELQESGLAPGSVRKVASVMSAVLDFAMVTGCLSANPMRAVKRPKQPLSRRRYLSTDQVELLAAEAGEDHAPIVYTLAYAGLRIGELAALEVSSLDPVRNRLLVDQSATEVDGVLVVSAPKDHQRRSVPFPAFLRPMLDGLAMGRAPDELLFTTARGHAIRVRNRRRDWFAAAATRAGLDGLVPHELRHTAASLAIASGASALLVQRMLGHSKPSVTLDIYSDLFDRELDDVAERMEAVRAVSLGSKTVRMG